MATKEKKHRVIKVRVRSSSRSSEVSPASVHELLQTNEELLNEYERQHQSKLCTSTSPH